MNRNGIFAHVKRIAPWWNSFPFVRLLIPFVAGIFLQPSMQPTYPLAATGLFMLLNISLKILPVYQQFRLRYIKGLWLHTLLFSFGMLTAFSHDIRNSTSWFGHHQYNGLLARTTGEPKQGKYAFYVNARLEYRYAQGKWQPAPGWLRIKITGESKPIHTGSLICLTKKPQPVVNRPGSSFNFRAYLANQNIYHQVTLKNDELMVIDANEPQIQIVQVLRKHILTVLDSNFQQPAERALSKALLVGYRDDLDDDTIKAYTDTGVIHVIAISGLHLGLIYGLLLILTRPLHNGRKAKLLVNILIAVTLWTFTLICGASASVVRSAVMFTSLLVGDSIGSDNNTGNALASSAFLLLCYDPFLLRDIGFQLSYAAVASLLIYNRAISSIYYPENGILMQFWTSISTSVSAQILTTPLVLVHFHQFPLLFILSNLVAVPVSGIILILLIFLCILQTIPLLATVITWIATWFIRFMNNQVSRIASVPFSSWKEISWSSSDLIFSYLLILFFTIFLKTRYPGALIFFLLTILTWLITRKYSL
ncbi:MAG TPA: ComEC/Rec2 family competence protein [Chitinophagaceae bacterium]|nr:ComEC/Rec2 family competence protein [Chitinophagaceae bacterium]